MSEATIATVDEFAAEIISLSNDNPPSSISNLATRKYKLREFIRQSGCGDDFMSRLCARASCRGLKSISDLKTSDDLIAVKNTSNAIISLGLIGGSSESRKEACVLGLIKSLKIGYPLLVGDVVSVLSRLKALDSVAVSEMTGKLLESTDEVVRNNVAIALAKGKDARAVSILIDLLRDRDSDIRSSARSALIEYRGRGFLLGSANAKKWEKWWVNTSKSL